MERILSHMSGIQEKLLNSMVESEVKVAQPLKVVSLEGNVSTVGLETDVYSMLDSVEEVQSLVEGLRRIERNLGHETSDVDLDGIFGVVCDSTSAKSTSSNELPTRHVSIDESVSLVLASQCLSAYVSTLTPTHQTHLLTHITTETTNWISRLFRYPVSTASYDDDRGEGLVSICRHVLRTHYPEFDERGYQVFHQRAPVVYVSQAADLATAYSLCLRLGLPQGSVCVVPLTTGRQDSNAMDVEALRDLVLEHKAANRAPLILLSHAGTWLTGHMDYLDDLQEVCEEHGIWLHAEGDLLALLSLLEVSHYLYTATLCNSLTLDLGAWLGLPSIPYITLYRSKSVPVTGRLTAIVREELYKPVDVEPQKESLPVWLVLQFLGHDGMAARIYHAQTLARELRSELDGIPDIVYTLPASPKRLPSSSDSDNSLFTIRGLIAKAISTFVVFKSDNPVVLFRYMGNPDNSAEKPNDSKESLGIPDDVIATGDGAGKPEDSEQSSKKPDEVIADESPKAISVEALSPLTEGVLSDGGEGILSDGGVESGEEFDGLFEACSDNVLSTDRQHQENAGPLMDELSKNKPRHGAVSQETECQTACQVLDKANIWLCERLSARSTKIRLSTVSVGRFGTCLRYSPYDEGQVCRQVSTRDIGALVESIKTEVQLLNSVFSMRRIVGDVVSGLEALRLTAATAWDGAGAVRYMTRSLDSDVIETFDFNEKIVETLHSENVHLEIGDSVDGGSCIVLGAVTDRVQLETMCQRIHDIGQTLQLSQQLQATEAVNETIRRSILDAVKQTIKLEQDGATVRQSVLRVVPVVGSIVNWWSSVNHSTQGRSFNLSLDDVNPMNKHEQVSTNAN